MDVDEVNQDHIPDEVLDFIGRGGVEHADNREAEPEAEDLLQTGSSVSEAAHHDEPEMVIDRHVPDTGLYDPNAASENDESAAPEAGPRIAEGSQNNEGHEERGAGQAEGVEHVEPPRKKSRKGKAPEAPSRVSTRQRVAATAGARTDARFRHSATPPPGQSPRPLVVKRGQQVPAPYAVAPDSTLTNKEQLDILRNYYIKNPTPTKNELIDLGRITGRPWTKVKEYFRQRRNKLRGVEDIDELLEPERAVSWLHMCYRSANNPQKSVSQLELYQSYKVRFDAFHKSAPLLGGSDLIQLTCATFPFCTMAKDDTGPGGSTEWLLKGIRRKMADDEEGEGDVDLAGAVRAAQEAYTIDATTAEAMQDFVTNMPEPLRAGTWLLEDFQDLQAIPQEDRSSAEPPITQTQLYAEYAGRFGEVIRQESQAGPSKADQGGEQQSTASTAANDNVGDQGIDGQSSGTASMDAQGVQAISNSQLAVGEAGPSTMGGAGDAESENAQIEIERVVANSYEYKPPTPNRLLTPLELIQLTKMTFNNADAVIGEDGRYIITGIEKRLGVSKFKGKDVVGNAMFPFGLLDIPTSSPSHPFTSAIKRKLSVLEAEALTAAAPPLHQAAPASEHQDALSLADQYGHPHVPVGVDDQAMFDLMLAGVDAGNDMEVPYGEPLPEHDRELVEGLRRFKNSRLGKEVRDTCVSQ